jgi:hypothetical protein
MNKKSTQTLFGADCTKRDVMKTYDGVGKRLALRSGHIIWTPTGYEAWCTRGVDAPTGNLIPFW